MILAFIAALLAMAQDRAVTQTWHGRLAIGTVVYVLTGETTVGPADTIRFSLKLAPSNDAPFRVLEATLGISGGQIVFDNGVSRPIAPEVATAWRRQLENGFRPEPQVSPSEYDCRATGHERVCDSRAIVRIDNSLSGRLRLIYNQDRLMGLRFFSLAEWTNPFLEYVSLSLDIK